MAMRARLQKIRAVLAKPADHRSLSEKIMISGILSGLDHTTSLVLRLGSTLIITRMLAPEIFGLFAIVIAFQIILFMITDFGIRSLIIVSKDTHNPDFLRTCWSVQIVRGFFLWGIVALIALSLYGFQQAGLLSPDTTYGAPVLPAALAVSGMSVAIRSFETVNQHIYAKEMRLRRITILNITLAVIQPVMTILIALVHPTIWALVASAILSNVIAVILSFRLFDGPRMGWCWNRDHVAGLFRHGRWIMSQSALTAVIGQADQLILGAFLPAWHLGAYFLAKQIFSALPGLIEKLHGSLGLQVFTDLVARPDPSELRSRYYRYRAPIDLTACFMAGGALTAAPALIDLMYDPRYLPAGEILQILALGLPMTGMVMIRDAFMAQKRFHIGALMGLIQALSIWIGLVVALTILQDPTFAFLAIALHRIPEVCVILLLARREGWVELWREIRFFLVLPAGALAGWGVSALYFHLATAT